MYVCKLIMWKSTKQQGLANFWVFNGLSIVLILLLHYFIYIYNIVIMLTCYCECVYDHECSQHHASFHVHVYFMWYVAIKIYIYWYWLTDCKGCSWVGLGKTPGKGKRWWIMEAEDGSNLTVTTFQVKDSELCTLRPVCSGYRCYALLVPESGWWWSMGWYEWMNIYNAHVKMAMQEYIIMHVFSAVCFCFCLFVWGRAYIFTCTP